MFSTLIDSVTVTMALPLFQVIPVLRASSEHPQFPRARCAAALAHLALSDRGCCVSACAQEPGLLLAASTNKALASSHSCGLSHSPLTKPRASVCISVPHPQQADALPPFEGAPLVQRGSVAQTRPLFPAAESCQPWLSSQKAALV